MAGCAEKISTGSQGNNISLINQGKLTVCTHLPYKPFQFTKDGRTVGFDVDLLDLVAKDFGATQEIVDTSFEGIESGEVFNTGKCDLAAAAMTVTDVRAAVMDFSDPYFDANQQLLLKKGSSVKKLADLKGKKLGVQQKTTGEEYAIKNKDTVGYDTVQFEDLVLMASAVRTGKVDAAINDNGVLLDFIKENQDTGVGESFATNEHYGIGMKKGASALRTKVNETLTKSKSNGSYESIYVKWFGRKPTN
jgi:polar amino acid transport system substrate-binding protein